jgi:hypothetical protein
VEMPDERQTAEAVVAEITGVKHVLNEIVVLPPRGHLGAT